MDQPTMAGIRRQYLDALQEMVTNSISPGIIIVCYDEYRSKGGRPSREMQVQYAKAEERERNDIGERISTQRLAVPRARFYGLDGHGVFLERILDPGPRDAFLTYLEVQVDDVPDVSKGKKAEPFSWSMATVAIVGLVLASAGYNMS